ncbi:hypothetical protein [Blastococcus deserti]|uniref:DUF5671 domain-containing protein n=1 Tax=Blastococcus deserti TaxID=2259033 RepID=A0ABW4XF08_9ACTN
MTAQDRLTLRNVYLYFVCLITLVVSIFAAVQLVRSAVGLAYPDPGYYGYYGYPAPADENGQQISEEELRRQEEIARDSQRRNEVLGLVGSGTTLLIAGPLYLYHWRRVQAELPTRATPDTPVATAP